MLTMLYMLSGTIGMNLTFANIERIPKGAIVTWIALKMAP